MKSAREGMPKTEKDVRMLAARERVRRLQKETKSDRRAQEHRKRLALKEVFNS